MSIRTREVDAGVSSSHRELPLPDCGAFRTMRDGADGFEVVPTALQSLTPLGQDVDSGVSVPGPRGAGGGQSSSLTRPRVRGGCRRSLLYC